MATDTVTPRQEARALMLAKSVLEQKRRALREPTLTALVEVKPERNLIGFILALPHGEHQVASQPAVPIKQATQETLEKAFDEGMRVIREVLEMETSK